MVYDPGEPGGPRWTGRSVRGGAAQHREQCSEEDHVQGVAKGAVGEVMLMTL